MDLDYLRTYSDLRSGKLSFHQFMDFVSAAYMLGHQNGVAQAKTRACLNQAVASAAGSTPARLDYETVF